MPKPYPTLQIALSPNNPEHVRILSYVQNLERKRHGFRSRLLEEALLMYIDHKETRGEEAPPYWKPLPGKENATVVLDPPTQKE